MVWDKRLGCLIVLFRLFLGCNINNHICCCLSWTGHSWKIWYSLVMTVLNRWISSHLAHFFDKFFIIRRLNCCLFHFHFTGLLFSRFYNENNNVFFPSWQPRFTDSSSPKAAGTCTHSWMRISQTTVCTVYFWILHNKLRALSCSPQKKTF